MQQSGYRKFGCSLPLQAIVLGADMLTVSAGTDWTLPRPAGTEPAMLHDQVFGDAGVSGLGKETTG
jgi:hypothetical protein